jgi:small GTP-binding protein
MHLDCAPSNLRVVTIGEESVGKTSITCRLVSDAFNPFESGTVGANFQQYTEIVSGNKLEIQIWDTAGQEKFKSLCPIYFRNAAAAVCVFSLTSRASFANLCTWIQNFVQIAGNKALIFIAANKSDLKADFEVELAEARDWAQTQHYPLYVTSAKTGEGIRQMFRDLARDLCEKGFVDTSETQLTKPQMDWQCCE